MSRSHTAAGGSSAISRAGATITSRCRRSGTSRILAGCPTTCRRTPIGGRRFIPMTICSVRPARCATAATRSTTTSRQRASPNGTSAARPATERVAPMSPTRCGRRSSIRRGSIMSRRTTPAFAVTRRAGQRPIQSTASITIGRSGFTWECGSPTFGILSPTRREN
jgi:hypothetical protein